MEINFDWNFENVEDTFNKINILQLALIMACEDLSFYEDITSAEYKAKCYIEKAKESLKSSQEKRK